MQHQPTARRRPAEGVEVRHARACPAAFDHEARCRCKPTYRAWVWSRRDRKKIRSKPFERLQEAKSWRSDAAGQVRRGALRSRSQIALREYGEAWLKDAKSGVIRKRGGEPCKPSALRSYEDALLSRIFPEFGGARLTDISRLDLQDFADRLQAEGLSPSTIRNTLMPLRAIYRRALVRGDVSVNPTSSLELPAVTGRRFRFADPVEATTLLEALPTRDRALWATAFYAGLRCGELQALRWSDVDLERGRLYVKSSFDNKSRVFGEPKSKAGGRRIPVVAGLRGILRAYMLETGRREGLVFGRDGVRPFTPSNVGRRARTAWKNASAARSRHGLPPLEPITLHECRHTYASLMIAAGVNAKALSSYMGHKSITTTLDDYGHLMPGNEDEAAELLENYLARAGGLSRP